ncbi:hypothetical protein [Actinokineospora spheciospongiae]|uniref:hypothetical protein n=1 Tax=Actinokineospora spheciospongiae TaxID=909613 RepID=UPI000D709943|nr:hypothetical protein [Actinokineospora spheciospongiae]PWW50261.1 hypothetical protein DFQ13_12323 [Actinokineospora spheciospongiae]
MDSLPNRPPTSGPGSSVTAWRSYATAVTGSPVESWDAMSREDIIARLESEGVESPDALAETAGQLAEELPVEELLADELPAPAVLAATPRRRRPVWMVPTVDGPVPEPEHTRGR